MTARSTAQTDADTIKNETTPNANTATRVGTMLRELTDGCVFIEDKSSNAGDFQPTGSAAAAGGSGKFADAAHIHPIGGIIGQVVADGAARVAVTPSSENVLAGKIYKQSAGSPLWIPLGTGLTDWRMLQLWPNDINVAYAFHDDLDFGSSTPLIGGFVLPRAEMALVLSGTGTACTAVAANDNTEIGVLRLSTGTTSTGAALFMKRATVNSGVVPTSASFIYGDARVRPQALSTGAQEYSVFFGHSDGAGNHKFGFLYDRTINVNWLLMTQDGGAVNTADTGVAFTANLAHRLSFVKLPGEMGLRGFIGGSAVGGGLITTSFTSSRCGLELNISSSVGGTAKTLDVDWIGGLFDYGGSRA